MEHLSKEQLARIVRTSLDLITVLGEAVPKQPDLIPMGLNAIRALKAQGWHYDHSAQQWMNPALDPGYFTNMKQATEANNQLSAENARVEQENTKLRFELARANEAAGDALGELATALLLDEAVKRLQSRLPSDAEARMIRTLASKVPFAQFSQPVAPQPATDGLTITRAEHEPKERHIPEWQSYSVTTKDGSHGACINVVRRTAGRLGDDPNFAAIDARLLAGNPQ
jgi:hypothetical protein